MTLSAALVAQDETIKPRKCKECAHLKKHLKDLTLAVQQYIKAIDAEMLKPSDVDRGNRIARLSNALEMANDSARFFGLKVDYRKDKKS